MEKEDGCTSEICINVNDNLGRKKFRSFVA